ncbi:succinate-semialdehyde dehydrogenase [bacterium]|nr:succinate-semialdehyde dehydrogenase [bacterium]
MNSPDETRATGLPDRLKDRSLLETRAYLAGEWVNADDQSVFEVRNPSRGDVIAQVADVSRVEAARAIAAATEAQREWATRTGKERARVLRAWFDLIVENADDLATILTAEQGKPLAEARGEVMYGASFIDWFAEEARRIYGRTVPGHERDKRIIVMRQPVGVAASITPWNFPIAMITRKAGPALAAGCAFISRPATETPLSALALAVLAGRAGLPKGVLSVLPSSRAAEIGQEFCDNPLVRKLTFTGSTEVGRILLRQASDQIKSCSMELGGNAPFLVFDDADIDAAVRGAVASKFRNSGQTCVCANRIYVQAQVYDVFAERFAKAVSDLRVGDGLDPGSDLGPLISEAAVAKVEAHIADAVSKGAKVIAGGGRHALGGSFFQPTILTGAREDMAFAREETFGPVAPLFRFEDEQDALAMANDTIFGLAAYVYSGGLARVTRVVEALEYGIVGVNTGIISTEAAPFGGVKQSGLGREGGQEGVEAFLETKYVCLSV